MNRVFIVRPFGTQSNVNFDAVDAELIQPALAAAGLEGSTTTTIVEAGNIREDMFRLLVTADLVIADISIHNANVFYELGVRHGVRPNRTYMLRANVDKVPFDLSTDRYLGYDAENPAAKVADLARALLATIESTRTDSPVYAMLPSLVAPDPSALIVVPYEFGEAVSLAREAKQRGDLRLLAWEARGFDWESEGLRLVGRGQFAINANPGAIETYQWLRDRKPADIEANLRLATLYQRAGDLQRSNQAIDRVIASPSIEPHMLAEAQALRGSNLKTVWRRKWGDGAATPSVEEKRSLALNAPELEESAQTYRNGFLSDLNAYYPGLNALSLNCLRIELARASPDAWSDLFPTPEDAAKALKDCEADFAAVATSVRFTLQASHARLERMPQPPEEDRTWLAISEADFVFLTSSQPKEVTRSYAKALATAPPFALDAARSQLRLFEGLGLRPSFVEAALRSIPGAAEPDAAVKNTKPRVLLFTGHMIDKAGAEPRFPKTKAAETEARRLIREEILKEQALAKEGMVGVAGGACGADILFHEICAELNIPTDLYLALPPDKFIVTSVAHGGADWTERFKALCQRVPPRILSETEELPVWLRSKPKYGLWQRNNLWMLFNALAMNSEALTLIALWDRGQARGPGGTEDLVAQVTSRGQKILIAPAQKLRELTS